MALELILTFHGLGEPPDTVTEGERKVWVPVEWFEAIVATLPRAGVALAFDDGNDSDLQHALPTLLRFGMTARFFPLVGRIDANGYLSAEAILELSAAGMRIGSHGLHHRDWRKLDDEELRAELLTPREQLSRIIGSEITEAACPFGSYDRRVLRALRAAGYRRTFNSDGGTASAGSWLSPRTSVHRELPLQHWLDLAAAGAAGRPSLAESGKRLVKRLR
ncbi:MAG TPA: polysaccharide deacetylase family protein [Solirubrobacteraceae bacterium]|nr:polysaccharide deacetylase family protein [Solirubrobacteraceae bacterium]